MTQFGSIQEVREAIGTAIGPAEAFQVDQARIDAFADATDDPQWIHIDPVRAADGPYGATIAHGYLTLSLLPHFGRELVQIGFGSARLNYGLNKVRFPAPVRVGSSLTATATILEVTDVPAGSMVTIRYVVDAGGDKPACIAESVMLIVD